MIVFHANVMANPTNTAQANDLQFGAEFNARYWFGV
jgi:hypothetical protein